MVEASNPPTTRNASSDAPPRGRPTTAWETSMDAAPRPVDDVVKTRLIDDFELHRTLPDERPGNLPEVPGFEVIDVLGEGGMGIVYKARNVALKRLVALKMIAPEHCGPNTRRRFQREAETVARLQHPNVVQIYEVGEHDGRPYLALELIEGGTLAQQLAKNGPLPARDAALMVATLARAMQYAHERHVIHRDLKPSNILLQSPESRSRAVDSQADTITQTSIRHDAARVPKITDFGLARMLDAGQEHTRTGAILGTPAYMAPEQAAGRGDIVGPATDIYALGVLLYETLTGRPPFSGNSSWDVLVQIIHTDPIPPSKLRPQLSRDLDTICLKALAKHPFDRYATAAAFADDLERFAAGEAIAARPESRLSKLGRKLRRHPIRLAVLVLLAGALSAAGLYSLHVRVEARRGLGQARQFAADGSHDEAARRYRQASELGSTWPVARDLQRTINLEWRDVRRRQIAKELHAHAQRLRFRFDPDSMTNADQRALAVECRRFWESRDDILAFSDPERDPDWERAIQADLLDVALLSSNLSVRLAEGAAALAAREQALTTLGEIESLYGPSLAVALQRQQHERALGKPVTRRLGELKARTAWDHYLLGRTLLMTARSNADCATALKALEIAIDMNPEETVFLFAAGRAALESGDYISADRYFFACIGPSEQNRDVCYYNHGLAVFHAGNHDLALRDFGAAIALNEQFAAAWLNRGLVHHRLKEFNVARSDLQKALELGADAALVNYNLAVVSQSNGDLRSARRHIAEALRIRPNYSEAKQLRKQLQ